MVWGIFVCLDQWHEGEATEASDVDFLVSIKELKGWKYFGLELHCKRHWGVKWMWCLTMRFITCCAIKIMREAIPRMNRDLTLLRFIVLTHENVALHVASTCSDFTKERAISYELIALGEAVKDISDNLEKILSPHSVATHQRHTQSPCT